MAAGIYQVCKYGKVKSMNLSTFTSLGSPALFFVVSPPLQIMLYISIITIYFIKINTFGLKFGLTFKLYLFGHNI